MGLSVLGEENQDDDYQVCCLLIVFIAVALPKLARADHTFFKGSWCGMSDSVGSVYGWVSMAFHF